MSRPTSFKIDATIHWTIRTYTSAGVLVDADANPSVAIRKNGIATADVATVTKRSATTGVYDCSYDPAGEASGDSYTIEETATISSQDYENSWSIQCQADISQADVRSSLGMLLSYNLDARLSDILSAVGSLNNFDPTSDTVTANVQSVATDAIDAAALKADAVAEIQTGLATASELANVPKLNTQYTHTAQSGDTIQITIS